MTYKPEEDGITHINIYSKGQTKLGKFLSNFTYCPIYISNVGLFNSIEGYWYYLLCNMFKNNEQSDLYWAQVDRLKNLYGFEAKSVGRSLTNNIDYNESDEFKQKIKQALKTKILSPSGKSFLKDFENSTLPFVHYYNYKGKIVIPKQGQWVIEYIEELRKEQKKFRTKNKISFSLGMDNPDDPGESDFSDYDDDESD